MFASVAECYLRDGFHLKAIALVKQVLRLDPALIAARALLAHASVHSGLIEEARAEYAVLVSSFQWAGSADDATKVVEAMAPLSTAGAGNG
jgi:cytochrome c-type biogenesis protein CcmH/NrfG